MKETTAANLKFYNKAMEIWKSIKATYAQKGNNARILKLKKEIAGFKQGYISIGNYYAKFMAQLNLAKLRTKLIALSLVDQVNQVAGPLRCTYGRAIVLVK